MLRRGEWLVMLAVSMSAVSAAALMRRARLLGDMLKAGSSRRVVHCCQQVSKRAFRRDMSSGSAVRMKVPSRSATTAR